MTLQLGDQASGTLDGMAQIIVGMDESDGAAAALRWALHESEIRGWPVRAVLAWSLLDQQQLDGSDTFDPDYNQRFAIQALSAAVERAVGPDAAASVDLQAVNDLPADALVEQSTNADLLVVGARGLGGFKSLLLGSVSNHCVQRASCPVVVVHTSAESPGHRPERIVVGIDCSEGGDVVLHWALDTARAHDATVEVVHAWQPVLLGGALSPVVIDLTPLEDAARHALDAIVDAADTHDVTVERTLVASGAAGAILDAATNADLVVVGTRGRGGVKSLLLGSVSQQVTHHAACPVVVVPPTG